VDTLIELDSITRPSDHIIVMIATGAFSASPKLDRLVAIAGERP
jgi:hypothetical protein